MDRFHAITAFVRVVEAGSFVGAADRMGVSVSAVSRQVAELEAHLAARLLNRTTRRLSLTESGQAFYERCVQLLADLEEAEESVTASAALPRGTLRLTTSISFGVGYLAPAVAEFGARHPQVRFDIQLSDRAVDLVDEGIDLAIRIGALSDSRLIARRLCTNQRVLVAAPSYIERHGAPEHPEELSQHECIIYTGFAKPREWKLLGPDGPVSVSVAGRVATNNMEVVDNTSKKGLGISVGPTMSAYQALMAGDLVRILPSYAFEPSAIFAVYPSARQLSTKVRAVVDFLIEKFQDPPSWDRALTGKVAGFP